MPLHVTYSYTIILSNTYCVHCVQYFPYSFWLADLDLHTSFTVYTYLIDYFFTFFQHLWGPFMTYTLQYTVITFFVGLYWSTHFLKPLFSLFVCRLILTLTLFCYPLISLYLSASPDLQKKSSSNARLQVNPVQKNSCALLLTYKHPLFNMLFGLCTNLLALPTDSLIVLYCIQDFYLHNTHLLSTVLYSVHTAFSSMLFWWSIPTNVIGSHNVNTLQQ